LLAVDLVHQRHGNGGDNHVKDPNPDVGQQGSVNPEANVGKNGWGVVQHGVAPHHLLENRQTNRGDQRWPHHRPKEFFQAAVLHVDLFIDLGHVGVYGGRIVVVDVHQNSPGIGIPTDFHQV